MNTRRRALYGSSKPDEIIATRGENTVTNDLLDTMYNGGYSASNQVLYRSEAEAFTDYLKVYDVWQATGILTATQYFINAKNVTVEQNNRQTRDIICYYPPITGTLSNYAFYEIRNSVKVIFTGLIPPSLNNYSIKSAAEVYVPDSAYDAYVTSFKNKYSGTILKHSDLTQEERDKIKVVTYE